MKTKSIRAISLLLAVVLAVSMICVTAWATDDGGTTALENSYDKLDTNVLTNIGQEPEEMSVSAKADYFDKQWYEYIAYSDHAVASYKISETQWLKFYDPYDYLASMVMEVTEDESIGWSTANSVTVSHEFSKSFSGDVTETAESSSDLEQTKGMDVTGSSTISVGQTLSKETHEEYSISASVSAEESVETTVGATVETSVEELGVKVGASANTEVTIGASASVSAETGSVVGSSTSLDSEFSDSQTIGWSTVADRVTMSTGSSTSTSRGWSTSETVSISRTFEAAHFNSDGVPLNWTLVHYEVKMPMKAVLQYKINGRWVTVDTDYVLLTTLNGTCRAWQENGATYYEHWATSEPVLYAEFWSNFFTQDGLVDAYQNKMYPTN